MVIIAVVIFFGVILGILIVKYGQKRSFSSWLVEKMFAYRKYKLSKKVDNYKGVETQRNRNIPYHLDNPEEIVGFSTQEYDVNGMQVFIINDQKQSHQPVIYYLYGSVYLRRPEKLHFKTVKHLIQLTNAKVVFPNFPKVPYATYQDVYPKLVEAYQQFCLSNGPSQVSVIGDSSGGGMALAFAKYIRDTKTAPQPKQLILISPWLDVSFKNQAYKDFEAEEAYLDARRLRDIGELWAGGQGNMQLPYVSPLYGDYEDLPEITTFVGTKEIFYPDIMSLHDQLTRQRIANQLIIAEKMIHAYVIFPIREAKQARKQIAELVLKTVEHT
ncbi:TPA: alpha/beta hydrolase [Streptococcus pyogenes]|uniref:alpha/beta hydrolase n=1 Tax=Streptococcus pyogenes TaxID=1314 RepID=UPI000DA380C5|nr:alpha/beta hydrolase [Streptococcus pyogenes]HER4636488.1 alpha/beta hydrolase [Streptococcus pyogenes NGAS510]HER4812307.1 alpha/beta hydrolase [Streptococcus pyogenes NGAS075]MZX74696.1 alpha/beta hydrolase fold domain-containing protein [Streptococcus pyogenes]MZX83114.1 alpha/beta hydrolase fold domain-containing protein [Streptococcus pyogenes]QQA64961.1 alpha/beta hydrolase [Streptococcus pyogenes]